MIHFSAFHIRSGLFPAETWQQEYPAANRELGRLTPAKFRRRVAAIELLNAIIDSVVAINNKMLDPDHFDQRMGAEDVFLRHVKRFTHEALAEAAPHEVKELIRWMSSEHPSQLENWEGWELAHVIRANALITGKPVPLPNGF